ncbi:unnamed protein product [Ixodes pacificus]
MLHKLQPSGIGRISRLPSLAKSSLSVIVKGFWVTFFFYITRAPRSMLGKWAHLLHTLALSA